MKLMPGELYCFALGDTAQRVVKQITKPGIIVLRAVAANYCKLGD